MGVPRSSVLGRTARGLAISAGSAAKPLMAAGISPSGVKEALIFPEVDIDKLDKVPGMNICIHTSAATDEEGRALLEKAGNCRFGARKWRNHTPCP